MTAEMAQVAERVETPSEPPPNTGEPPSVAWVQAEHVDNLWPWVVEHIAKALRCGGAEGWSLESVRQDLKEGRKLLWVGHREGQVVSVMVTEVVDLPHKAVMHVYAVGGYRLEDWIDVFDQSVMHYAKELKLDAVQAYAREGVSKLLKRKGWKRSVVVMERPIGDDDGTI